MIIVNTTSGTISYPNEGITITANSSYTVPMYQIAAVAVDPTVVSDLSAGNTLLSDGTNSFSAGSAISFLYQQANLINSLTKQGSGAITSGSGSTSMITISTNGAAAISATITGTWSATIILEGTNDNVNWFTWAFVLPDGTIASSFSANGTAIAPCGGFQQIRLRATSYTSGTINITWNSTSAVNTVQVYSQQAASFQAEVRGNVSSLTADVGKPIKVGTVYNAVDPAPASGQRVDTQSNLHGHIAVQYRNKYSNLTGNTTTTVKSGAGVLHSIVINNNTSGGTITIYDNTAGSGTVMFTITIGTPSGGLLSASGMPGPFSTGPMGLEFSTGLTVVTAGSTSNNITLLYR